MSDELTVKMQRRVPIRLTDAQFHQATKLAQARNKKEKRFGAMTYGGKRGGLEAHLIGMVPELAVSLAGHGKVDTRIFDTHGDNGIDTDLPSLGKCGIKTTTYEREPLLRVEVEHFSEEIDSYVLCYYEPKKDPKTVWIIGWATKDEVKQAPRRRLLQGGPLNYILLESQLHAWLPI